MLATISIGLVHLGAIDIPLEYNSSIIAIASFVFMFRMIYYMYEMKHDDSIQWSIKNFSYFFLFPNFTMPLFPIIDFRIFRKSIEKKEIDESITLSGANLIAIAIGQLILYRVVYLYLTPGIEEINNIGTLWQFMLFSYLQVLRLMGLLNFSVGVFRVLGFDLPDIFNNMFLATGVLDYFRRINIYWKDFLLRVFYYPLVTKFKRWKLTTRMMMAGGVIFIVNWLLHDYQWFWILGSIPFKLNNIIYWGIFGVLALWGMYHELTKSNNKNKAEDSSMAGLKYSSNVVFTFVLMMVLWSMWISQDLSTWVDMLQKGSQSMSGAISLVIIIFVVYGLLFFGYRNRKDLSKMMNSMSGLPSSYLNTTLLASSILICFLAKNQMLVPETYFDSFLNNVESSEDASQRFKGYYDELITTNIGSSLWIDRSADNQQVRNTVKGYENHDDPRMQSLRENALIHNKYSGDQKINRWGHRDKEYKNPIEENLNVAIIGGSIEVGLSNPPESVFEFQIEEKINEINPLLGYRSFNFSSGHHTLPQYVYTLKSLDFEYFNLDYAFIFYHLNDDKNLVKSIERVIEKDVSVDEFDPIIDSYLSYNKPFTEAEIKAVSNQLMDWSLPRISALCTDNNVKPVFVVLPKIAFMEKLDVEALASEKAKFRDTLFKQVESLGFEIIDIMDAFDHKDLDALKTSPTNKHPNELGHTIIADELYPLIYELVNNSN